jgi:hypothetical protein
MYYLYSSLVLRADQADIADKGSSNYAQIVPVATDIEADASTGVVVDLCRCGSR